MRFHVHVHVPLCVCVLQAPAYPSNSTGGALRHSLPAHDEGTGTAVWGEAQERVQLTGQLIVMKPIPESAHSHVTHS